MDANDVTNNVGTSSAQRSDTPQRYTQAGGSRQEGQQGSGGNSRGEGATRVGLEQDGVDGCSSRAAN